MTEVLKTSLGKFSAVGAGDVRQGQVGSSTATATVSGAGAVSATVVIMGSNDKLGWQQIGSITLSGTGVAVGSASWGTDYAFWRADCSALSGGELLVSVSTDQTGGVDLSMPESIAAVNAAVADAVYGDAGTVVALQALVAAYLQAQGVGASASSIAGLGSPFVRYKSSGTDFDFSLATDGGPTAPSWTGLVPSDAVAIEIWSNGTAADDYIFWATRGGQLSSVGVLATNISNNNGATNPNRVLANGERVVIPLSVIGTVDSTLRFAGGKSTARLQGRFISSNSGFPYLLNAVDENVLVGAGASQQFAYTNTTKFPANTTGLVIQIKGTAGVRVRHDGGTPTATLGDYLAPGNYILDYARHGVAISALRLYIPSGAWVISSALKASA